MIKASKNLGSDSKSGGILTIPPPAAPVPRRKLRDCGETKHNSHHHEDTISSAPQYPNLNKMSCQIPVGRFEDLICLWFSHLHALAWEDKCAERF